MDFFDKSRVVKGRYLSSPEGDTTRFVDIIKWKFKGKKAKSWPTWRNSLALPSSPFVSSSPASATWINHSTVLLIINGVHILTDPVFADTIGPLKWLGIKRKAPPGISIDSLPRIDIVLISHNHYDHLDAYSIKTLNSKQNPLYIAPRGNKKLLQSLGCSKVIELDWWENHFAAPDLNIMLTPALHWSRRTLWDMCTSLWGSFVIQSKQYKIFFAGDTGYHAHFKMIYEKIGPIDFSLLPIGAYEPRWIMKNVHMNPADAVQAHLDLHSSKSMGIHFGTFRLTDEGIDDPVQELAIALAQAQIDPVSFIAPDLGQTIIF